MAKENTNVKQLVKDKINVLTAALSQYDGLESVELTKTYDAAMDMLFITAEVAVNDKPYIVTLPCNLTAFISLEIDNLIVKFMMSGLWFAVAYAKAIAAVTQIHERKTNWDKAALSHVLKSLSGSVDPLSGENKLVVVTISYDVVTVTYRNGDFAVDIQAK